MTSFKNINGYYRYISRRLAWVFTEALSTNQRFQNQIALSTAWDPSQAYSYKRWSRVLVPPLELAVACLAPHGSAWLRPNGWVWGHVQRAELGARDARERCQGTQGHQGHSRETREKRVSSTHKQRRPRRCPIVCQTVQTLQTHLCYF